MNISRIERGNAERPIYRCPFCKKGSGNINDLAQRYCAACHRHADDTIALLRLQLDRDEPRMDSSLFDALTGLCDTFVVPRKGRPMMMTAAPATWSCPRDWIRLAVEAYEQDPRRFTRLSEPLMIAGQAYDPGTYWITRLS